MVSLHPHQQALALIALASAMGCSAESPPGVGSTADGEGSSSDDGSASNSQRDAGPALAHPPDSPTCVAGERRGPRSAEEGNVCVCQSGGFWSCYGVSDARAIGGTARCASSLNISQESCLKVWSQCEDGHTYMITCPNSMCVCIVDAIIVGQLEPGTACPSTLEEANTACGWQLRRAAP